jgi:hypothetical protein
MIESMRSQYFPQTGGIRALVAATTPGTVSSTTLAR